MCPCRTRDPSKGQTICASALSRGHIVNSWWLPATRVFSSGLCCCIMMTLYKSQISRGAVSTCSSVPTSHCMSVWNTVQNEKKNVYQTTASCDKMVWLDDRNSLSVDTQQWLATGLDKTGSPFWKNLIFLFFKNIYFLIFTKTTISCRIQSPYRKKYAAADIRYVWFGKRRHRRTRMNGNDAISVSFDANKWCLPVWMSCKGGDRAWTQ